MRTPTIASVWTLLLLILLMGFQVSAQPPNTLTPDVLFEGEFTADNLTATFTFEGHADQIVSINAFGEHHWPISLTITAPNDTQLVHVTPGYFPELQTGNVQLPVDGRYVVTLTGSEPAPYTLMLRVRATPLISIGSGMQDYFYDTVRELEFTFEGEADQNVIVTASSEYFDPVLTVYAPDGEVIATDDDSGGSLRAQMTLGLQLTGTYRAFVSSYHPGNSGALYVHVLPIDDGLIRYGETREVTLNGDTQRLYFWGERGDVIEVRALDMSDVAEVTVGQPASSEYSLLGSTHEPDTPNLERILLPWDSGAQYPYSIVIKRRADTGTDPARVRISLFRRDHATLDSGSASVFMSVKNPVVDLHFEGDSGSNGTRLTVNQRENRTPMSAVVPFRMTVIAEDGTPLAAYIYDESQQIFSLDIGIWFDGGQGRIKVRLELLHPEAMHEPVWFHLTREFSYGEG